MLRRLIPLICLLWALVQVASAQTTFIQGAYEFEDCGSNCSLSGSWFVRDAGGYKHLYTTTNNGTATFYVQGQQLIIYRWISGNAWNLCVNASCVTVGGGSDATNTNYPVIAQLTGGVDTIVITSTTAFTYFDWFQVVDGIVPTATIVPSSTPAPTATPQPTSTPQPTWTLAPSITPQPTATPNAGAGGPDAASVYATLDSGQVTRFDYVATAGSVHIANLAAAIFFSIWAMFLLWVFVLREK